MMRSWTNGRNRRTSRIPECLDQDLLKSNRHRAQIFVTARSEGFAQGLKMVTGLYESGRGGRCLQGIAGNRFRAYSNTFPADKLRCTTVGFSSQ